MRRLLACTCGALLLVLSSSCRDNPIQPHEERTPAPSARDLGLLEVTLTGIGTPEMTASAHPVARAIPGGVSASLAPLPGGEEGGIQLEFISNGSFTEGTREQGGQRYMYATFRVRNATLQGVPYPDPRQNLTFVPVSIGSTIPGTPVSRLNRFDGTPADTAIAKKVVPTGAVILGPELEMQSVYPDVLQVFDEDEVAEFTAPAGVTERFPYGFVTRNPSRTDSRELPATPLRDQFDGVVTFAFRVPLQPHDPGMANGAEKDPFSVTVVFLAVDDPVTRVTESIEEQAPAAREVVRARAAQLNATQVTVLDGSSTLDPAVAPFPHQRQLCGTRVAGTAAAPTTRITAPGAFSRLAILKPGEAIAPCAPYFRSGTPARPATNVPFPLSVYATDRYGNIKSMVTDSVRITADLSGVTLPPVAPLAGGQGVFTIVYGEYGEDVCTARTSRVRSSVPIQVAGVTRRWTAGAGTTEWSTGGNWEHGAAPMQRDSVVIPQGVPHYPSLSSNVQVFGVRVEDGATLSIGAFDLTAGANVFTGSTGGIVSSTGRLGLAGTAATVRGNLPRLRITGTYSLDGNVNAVAPMRVESGRLRNGSFRLRIHSQ